MGADMQQRSPAGLELGTMQFYGQCLKPLGHQYTPKMLFNKILKVQYSS